MLKTPIISPNYFNSLFTGLGAERVFAPPHESYKGVSIYVDFNKTGASKIRANMPYPGFPCVDLILESEFFGLIDPVTHVLVPKLVTLRFFGSKQLREMQDTFYEINFVKTIEVDEHHRIEICQNTGRLKYTIFTVVDTGTVAGIQSGSTAAFSLEVNKEQYDQMYFVFNSANHIDESDGQ